MSGHTAGPWRISEHSETSVCASNDRGIATAGGYQTNMIDPDVLWEENVANARLIAAAPDLLETAKTMLEYYDAFVEDKTAFPGETEMYADPLREAITKAEGAK